MIKHWLIYLFTSFMISGLFVIINVDYYFGDPLTDNKSMHLELSKKKYVILTADDLGGGKCIDEGIFFGVEHGIINTISAFSNFPNSINIINKTINKFPKVKIGLHLNISSGQPISKPSEIPSLVDKNGYFYTIDEILKRMHKISLQQLELELSAQIDRFKTSKVKLDHISFHYNIMVIKPDFFDLVIELTKNLNVPLRNPLPISLENKAVFGDAGSIKKARKIGKKFFFSSPFRAIKSFKYAKKSNLKNALSKLKKNGITSSDHMIDYVYGHPTPKTVLHIFNNLPEGISEINFHLGKNCKTLGFEQGIDPDYIPDREEELMIATSHFLKTLLASKEIEIIGFNDINRIKNGRSK